MADRFYYLGPWIWEVDPDGIDSMWRAPDGCVGLIDLRSFPDLSVAGGSPGGFGLFAQDHEFIDSDYDLLARSIDDAIGPEARSRIGSRLGQQITQPRLDRMLYELLTLRGDPTGDNFARPLMPTMKRQMDIHLGGLIIRRPFRHDQPEHAAAIHQMREQYRADRQAVEDGIMPPDHHRRILDKLQKKLNIPWQALVPGDMPDEPGPLPHRTTLTDNFNRADEVLSASGWTEVFNSAAVVSNQAQSDTGATNNVRARFDSDLSGSDHYAKCDVTAWNAGNFVGPMARYASGADTGYVARWRNVTNFRGELNHVVTGSRTQIAAGALGAAPSVTWEARIDCDGSTITSDEDTVEQNSVTDTTITGNTRGGIWLNDIVAGVSVVDNFEAADLAVVAELPGRSFPRGAMRGVMRGVA